MLVLGGKRDGIASVVVVYLLVLRPLAGGIADIIRRGKSQPFFNKGLNLLNEVWTYVTKSLPF